jgi:glycosyltransferase involved in cell wall biosynthesis
MTATASAPRISFIPPRPAAEDRGDGAPRTRPVRVCFLIDELAPAGTETQLLALIRHVDRRLVQPYLCLLRGERERSRALEPDSCPVLRLGVGALCRPAALVAARRLAQFLRRERIDVLQVYFPDSTYFGLLAGRLAGVPVVRTRNDLGYWMTPLHRRLARVCGRLAHLTVTNCEAARQGVLANEGIAPESVVVLENGVDLSRFAALPALPADPGPVRVGIVAGMRPVKRLDLFLRAAAEVARVHPETTFEICGDGPSRPDLERLAEELRLGPRLHLPGELADVPAFLGRLTVAVLCSRSEGMSNALLEYMAAGRAIVATRVGANAEVLQEGQSGLLVPSGDAAALAGAIRCLIEDPGLRVRLGAAARLRAEENYSRRAMVRRFERFYQGLLAERRAA